jgi:hypothetical protein
MDILSKEELNQLNSGFRGRGNNPLVSALIKLEIGEGVKLSKEEWNYKTSVSS